MSRFLPLALSLLVPIGAALLPSRAGGQSLRGSSSSVNRMYYHAVDHGMYFYKTRGGLKKAAAEGRFVRLKGNSDYRVVGATFPYAQEAALLFIERLGKQYHEQCGERMVVTSGVRPQSMRLANSVDKSVHPTGMAVDLRKPARSACRAWLRETLVALEGRGVIEATEEYTPPHFHVAVFPAPYTRYARGTAAPAAPSLALNTPPDQYRVRTGDSLWGIAQSHATSVERLRSVNGLGNTSLKIGQLLIIPR
jgi:hypothetical protein